MNRAFRLLLAVALLAGWQGALLHPLTHADAKSGLIHVASPATSDSQNGGSGIRARCEVIAALAAVVENASTPLALRDPRNLGEPITAQAWFLSSPPIAYRSQAPPAFL